MFLLIMCFVISNNWSNYVLFGNCANSRGPVKNEVGRNQTNIIVNGGKAYHFQTFTPYRLRRPVSFENDKKKNLPSQSGNSTSCSTPNHDKGICLNIEDCPVLNKVHKNSKNQHFLRNSTCDESSDAIRYCCGKYENFKYLLPKRPLPKECGYDFIDPIKNGKVMGGTEAKLGEFPWLARIIHTTAEGEKSVGCEGFLIHKRFIMTAAHCVKSPRIAIVGNISEIQLGEHNTLTENDCYGSKCADPLQTMRVKGIIPHPEYRQNSRDHHYDIALIYLKGEVKFSEYVQPICVMDKSFEPTAYWISGWGKTENGTYSDVKMKLSIPPFDITECNKLFAKFQAKVGQSQLCAGGQKNRDSCVGDSGGPLMFRANDSRWYAIGLVSYGASCGMEGWPGVYTNIPFFYEWIIEEIIKLREPNLIEHA